MASTSFTELYDIYKNILNNEELNMFIEEVIKMSSQYAINLHEWEKEKLDYLVKITEEKRIKKENNIEIANKLLARGETIDYIVEITTLTEEEVLKLKNGESLEE